MDYGDSDGDDNFSEGEGDTIHTNSSDDDDDSMDVDNNNRNRPQRNRAPAAKRAGRGGRRVVRARGRNAGRQRQQPADDADLDPMMDSANGSSDSTGSSSSDGDDDDNNAPPPPAPPPREVYDMYLEDIYARSVFARQVRVDRVFGPLRAQEPVKDAIVPDPLSGARINPDHFKSIIDNQDAFCQAAPASAWSFLTDQFGQLCILKEIPIGNPLAQVDFMDDLALAVDCANMYPHPPPPGKMEDLFAEQVGCLGRVCWDFYLKIRPTHHKRNVFWWITILNIHKLAVEKLPSIHGRLTFIYNDYTVGQFMREAEQDCVVSRKGTAIVENQNTHWLYMRHAHVNGFVGCTVPTTCVIARPVVAEGARSGRRTGAASAATATNDEADEIAYDESGIDAPVVLRDFHHSAITHSMPNRRILPDAGTISSRGVSLKIDLDKLFRQSASFMNIKFSCLTLKSFKAITEELHKNWNNLNWTPTAEFFLLLLFHHFSCLAVDGLKNRDLLDNYRLMKRKPVTVTLQPSRVQCTYKPLSKRFLRDMENIFMNHLETIHMHYSLVENTLAAVPQAPVEAIMAAESFRSQMERNGKLDDSYKWYRNSHPVGYFDTLCFPECQQFLPSISFLHQTDMLLLKTFLKKEAVVEGVGTDAAVRYYYDRLIRAVLPAGAFDSVLASVPSLIPKAAFVLDLLNRSSVVPVSTLTFKVLAAPTVLGFVRGNGLFSDLTIEPAHAPLASRAYACMVISMLHTSHFHFELDTETDINLPIAGGNAPQSVGQILTVMSGVGFGTIANEYLAENPRLSGIGNDKLSRRFAKFISERTSQQQQVTGNNAALAVTPAQQPTPVVPTYAQKLIEKIESARSWLILCDDTYRELVIQKSKHIAWTPGRDNWPRLLSVRGEYWAFVESARFFLRTVDFMEALYAWFTCVIQLFGKRLKLTGGYLTLFERHLGKTFREVLCTDVG